MNKTSDISDNFEFGNFDIPEIDLDFDIDAKDQAIGDMQGNEAPPSANELTDEIKSFRQKNKEFQATNDHETYLIVCFSCKEDKKKFLNSVELAGKNTLVDGYELANKIGREPQAPAYKLRAPLGR